MLLLHVVDGLARVRVSGKGSRIVANPATRVVDRFGCLTTSRQATAFFKARRLPANGKRLSHFLDDWILGENHNPTRKRGAAGSSLTRRVMNEVTDSQ